MAEEMKLEDKQLIFLGQKLINHYGCMNCHAINGMEGAASPCANLSDWGQKSVDKLDYGYLTHHKLPELPPRTPRLLEGEKDTVMLAAIPRGPSSTSAAPSP